MTSRDYWVFQAADPLNADILMRDFLTFVIGIYKLKKIHIHIIIVGHLLFSNGHMSLIKYRTRLSRA